MQNSKICFCKQEIMSLCSASNEKQQMDCHYYRKSSYRRGCMHSIFDEYCDCLEAQMSIEKEIVTQNDSSR
jgi:hypothetical protein